MIFSFKKTFLLLLISFFLLGFAGGVSAQIKQSQVILQPLPNTSTFCDENSGTCITGTRPNEVGSYLQGLFQLAVAIAGVLAVLMIVIGGLEYLLSEAFTSKADAIKRIQAALWGLIIILASVVILNTINPDLLNINLSLPDLQNRKTLSPSRFLSPEEVFKMGDVKPTADEQEEAKDRNKTIVGVKQPTESGDAFRSKCISVGGNVVSGECKGVLCFYGGRNMLCEK